MELFRARPLSQDQSMTAPPHSRWSTRRMHGTVEVSPCRVKTMPKTLATSTRPRLLPNVNKQLPRNGSKNPILDNTIWADRQRTNIARGYDTIAALRPHADDLNLCAQDGTAGRVSHDIPTAHRPSETSSETPCTHLPHKYSLGFLHPPDTIRPRTAPLRKTLSQRLPPIEPGPALTRSDRPENVADSPDSLVGSRSSHPSHMGHCQ